MVESLTNKQVAEIRETFALFDKQGTGSVTIEQMAIIFRALGQTPTEAEMENIKAEADPEGLGTVEYAEFLSIYARFQKDPVTETELLSAFDELDDKKMGNITVKKLRHLLSTCREPISDEEVRKLIKVAKPDAEGNINYKAFAKLLLAK